jgi:hypothetical protein
MLLIVYRLVGALNGAYQIEGPSSENNPLGSIIKMNMMRCLIGYYVKNRFEYKFVFDIVC